MHNRIMQKSWFRTLFGEEESRGYRQLQENFELLLNGTELKSKINNKTYRIGNFSTPTLAQIRNEALSAIAIENSCVLQHSKPSYEHIEIGDAFLLHIENPNATIQAASQFNCLEFTSHKTNPEHGVSIYEYDNTQGPACALACAAGTVFRNYFVVVDPNSPNIRGQTKNNQINNLDKLEDLMNNKEHEYWYVENGYTFSRDNANLVKLNERIEQEFSSVHQRNTLLDAVKVGVHSDVGVTFESRYRPVTEGREVSVTQVYCSAISCAYSGIGNNYWEPLAKLALDAAYEATLWAAVLNAIKHEAMKPEETHSAEDATVQSTTSRTAASNTLDLLTEHLDNTASIPQPVISRHKDVFLTFLGGGVFRNDTAWIANAIGRAIAIVSHHKPDLNIKICHFRNKDHLMAKLIDESYEVCRVGEKWRRSLACAPFSQNNYIQVPAELKVPSKGYNCDLSSVRTYVRFFEKKRAIDQRDVDLDELSNWLEYYDNLIAKKVQKLEDKVSTQNGELVSLRKRVEALADVLVSTANSQKIQQNAMNNQYGQRSLVMLLNKDLVEGDGVGDFEGLQKLGHNEVDSLLDLYDIDIEKDEGIKNKKRKLHNYLLTGFSNL